MGSEAAALDKMDLDSFRELVESTNKSDGLEPLPVLVIFSSGSCPRCPKFKEAVEELGALFHVRRVDVDASMLEEDLHGELALTKVPSFALCANGTYTVHNDASVDSLKESLTKTCTLNVAGDEDF